MWRSDISHLLDKYSKKRSHKTFDFSSFTFHAPFLPAHFDWFLQMKCQHAMDQTNFPMFPLLPGKLGWNITWQKEYIYIYISFFLCAGVRQYIKMQWFFLPDRKQTLMLLSACAAFHFVKEFVNYLDTLSVCACRVRFVVSTIMSRKSVVFCEVHSNEPVPTVLKFFRFSPRKWNAPRIALNASYLKRWILQVL